MLQATFSTEQLHTLTHQIKQWGDELGFQQIGITDIDLSNYEPRLLQWLAKELHGEMRYMKRYGVNRARPQAIQSNTVRVISTRMDYLPQDTAMIKILSNRSKGYIARYALGRDYHRLIRKRLQQLADRIQEHIGSFGYRAFCDSAPVMEKPLAEKAGLGWIGKHTNLINAKAGSWFFLGEIFTDLPLPCDAPQKQSHCGSCSACLDICPTQAIIAPYVLDARRCISYLTIEFHGIIPTALRQPIGNRIFGCDDCQLICPWNKFAKHTSEKQFTPRHALDNSDLIALFAWSEREFLDKTQSSAIRRIGHELWLRNIAVALGNAPFDADIVRALIKRRTNRSAIVREHVDWALQRQFIAGSCAYAQDDGYSGLGRFKKTSR